jgi:polysaccharide biosynthesis protein PslH
VSDVRILFLSARHPQPARRGDERRALHLLEGLARHASVTLLCFGGGPPLADSAVRVRGVTRSVGAGLRANAAERDPLCPLQVRLYLDAQMRGAVREEVRAWEPQAVHASTARMATYLREAGGAHRHLDLIDPLSVNMAHAARRAPLAMRPAYGLEARLMRRFEGGLSSMADSVSLVSDADRRAVPALAEAVVIPNGVDLSAFPFRSPADRPPVLTFFGNLGYVHNIPPARFVATEVLPPVAAEVPGAVLRIVGARPAASVRKLGEREGIEVVADVPRMADELHRAAVAVVPLLSGSGIKNKVLEAFAAGTPVVTNGLGVEGVAGAVAGKHFLGGETAADLAAAAVRLLRDPEERVRLAEAALELVRREYGWERQVRALLDVYGGAAGAA